jgi:hypothetical protein
MESNYLIQKDKHGINGTHRGRFAIQEAMDFGRKPIDWEAM